MRFRNSRLRIKITAMLASLLALWAFAAWVTVKDGLNLLSVTTIDERVGRPTVALVTDLQTERRLSSVYLGGGRSRAQQEALNAQRARTDESQARFRRLTSGSDVTRVAPADLEQRIRETSGGLDGLNAARRTIDSGRVTRDAVAKGFNDVIDAAFRVYALNARVDDQQTAEDGRTLIALTRANEILSREDALVAGILAEGRFAGDEHTRLVELIGTQRYLHAEAAAELPAADRTRYDQVVKGRAFTQFQALEDRITRSGRARTQLPVNATQWKSMIDPVVIELEQVVLAGGDDVVKRATPGAIWTVVRLALAGGLGLFTVIASLVVAITTARSLVRQLDRLRGSAWELADKRLPDVVERLGRGEDVDVTVEAPELEFGSDEIGQVGQAFNAAQRTAIKVAVEQAELRRGVRDVLLSIARRTQTLVRRQLSLLDEMERRDIDPAELEDLFRLDHLATRMRRNAENLVILSGETPARGWRNPVPMLDVLRSALAEVEHYSRVNVLPAPRVTLAGRAVADVVHLVAELVENATNFSPSYTVVQISGSTVASGYAIEIEDRGLGMSEEALEAANEQITSSPEFNLSRTARLGLYVVSRLANRYGIKVSLKHSAYGGTTAVIVVPRDLINEAEPGQTPEVLTTPRPVRDSHTEPGAPTPDSSADVIVLEKPNSRPAAIDPAEPTAEQPDTDHEVKRTTPSGLPVRVPQASIAQPLRTDETPPADEDDTPRTPAEIRKVMGALQAGTERGRAAAKAARAGGDQNEESASPQPLPAANGEETP
jgi:signal transduction histidine kinase